MPNIDNDTIQALKEIAKDKSVFRRNLRLRELVNAKKANKEKSEGGSASTFEQTAKIPLVPEM